MNCPGSVALCAKMPPDKGNIHSATGTVAHEIAEQMVTGKLDYFSACARIGAALISPYTLSWPQPHRLAISRGL